MKLFTALRLILILVSFSFIAACSKNGSAPTTKSPPVITSIDVNEGPYNTEVTITGTGFSSTVANNKVFFNGKAAIVGPPTTTRLFVKVPFAAGTGNITVMVDGLTATGPVFTYQPAEVVMPFAGGDNTGSVDGPIASATFYQPYGLALDAAGNIYVADQSNNLIRKITPTGQVSTLAGNGSNGFADGPGTAASFNGPSGVAVDVNGNVYVADMGNNLIRKISPSGQVSTFAGSEKGYADGMGSAAKFNRPTDVAVDKNGNVYVTDTYNYRIRKITPSGAVTTFAGNNTYFSADGVGTAASFDNPNDIVIDQTGNLYVSQGDNLIRKITPGGLVTCIAGTSAGSGLGAVTSSFGMPQGMAFDAQGDMYIECLGNYQIKKVTPDGQVTIFAGNGAQNDINGITSKASFSPLEGIIINANGDIYISVGNAIKKITFG